MNSRRLARSLGVLLLAAGCSHGPRPAPPAPVPAEAGRVAKPVPADTTQRERVTPPPSLPGNPAAVPVAAAAKTPANKPSNQRCILDFENTLETRAQSIEVDTVSHRRVTFVGGGVRGQCRGQDITIISDSAESYEQSQLHILIGNVHYREPRASIEAQRVTYYKNDERLLFENSVRAEMKDGGGVMVGPRVEYFRAVPAIRPKARMDATQRPELTYVEKDSLGRPQPPVKLNANQIIAEGDSTYYARGQVVLVRTDLVARGDSSFMDSNKRYARLMRGPVIESKGQQPFTLHGRIIDLFGNAKDIERVLALDSGRVDSKDLTLVADTIDLRVSQNHLQRTFAFGPTGATATTPERTVIADSLDIIMPGQRIRELRAIGKAYVESDPDTTRIKSDERDWLRGDTVVARFDTAATRDTTSKPQMRDVLATGNASSYYHAPPQNKKAATNQPVDKTRPGINYNRGRVIHLEFAKGQVETVTVEGKVSGVYLEPADSTETRRQQRAPRPAPGRTSPVVPPIRRPPPSAP